MIHGPSASAARLFPAMPQTIFCDFDGPIVDVSARYYATYRRCLEAMGTRIDSVRYLSRRQFWTFKQNRVPDRQIAHWSGLQGEQIDQFLSQVAETVNQGDLLAYDRPQVRVREALQRLRLQQVRVVLVTLRSQLQVHQFLHTYDLAWAVDEVHGHREESAAYANHAEHKVALLKDAITTQQFHSRSLRYTCMIGDTEADILAAQAAKIPSVALTCGIRSRRYLRGFRPTHIETNLRSLVSQMICSSESEVSALHC